MHNEKNLLREIYLIRHAESYGNIDGIDLTSISEKNDPVLTSNGIRQAEKLGDYWSNIDFDCILTSPLRRAVMTASALIGEKDNIVYIMPDLCEIGVSPEYPGLSFDELKEYCKKSVPIEGLENCNKTAIPDGSPWEFEERYFERADRVLGYLDTHFKNGEKVAVVSHAGFLTYIIFRLIGYRDKQPKYDFQLSNTGVTKISFFEPETNIYGDMIIEFVNDLRHLV